ncbi:Uncharacterized protein PECH_007378 [Penicillium ucsense]|uniref:Methyltransferase domain-containing protein n=1 Tax=Penicillium ucsense TaxID=2839758 RepID=A0A8J8W9D7_9EURO|nr:Uncharacterized protein PECM_003859 [Penicillium ucsense]KAF7734925.1 Uncharacterized protein PECH_007378 [Penicillium ucsense]
MSSHRTHTKIPGAPDYDSPQFWDARFASGQDVGEWLNPGEPLIDAFVKDLDGRFAETGTPRTLHLGPGVSTLGYKIQDVYQQRGWMSWNIVNVDFSAEAVRRGLESESQKPRDQAMAWHQADLLSWNDVSKLCPLGPFDLIMDKSTSDAIATSADRRLRLDTNDADDSSLCPVVREVLCQIGEIDISPVDLLALHLVPLTRKGTSWMVLSYSSLRFENRSLVDRFWSLRCRIPLKAPSGNTCSSAYTPDVYHWLYVLDRK